MDEKDSESGLFRNRLFAISGPALCVVIIFLILAFHVERMLGLSIFLIVIIAYSAMTGGLTPGITSTLIALGFFVYDTFWATRSLRREDFGRFLIFILTTPLVLLVLTKLRRRLNEHSLRETDLRVKAESAEQKLSSILERITDGFFALDRGWYFTYVNRAAEQLVGKSREALLGRIVWDVFPPLMGSSWEREYRRAIAEGTPVHFEDYYAPLNTWFETHAYPAKEGLTIYIRSINERKHAQFQLEARNGQQAAVAALGQEAIRSTDTISIMNSAVQVVRSTLRVEFVKILELTAKGNELIMRAGTGWKGGIHHRVPAGENSQAGYTLMRKEPVIVQDLRSDGRFHGPQLLLDHDVVSGMSVVIPGVHGPFGILGAHSRSTRQFTQDDAHFIQAVANILADVIERNRNSAALAESERRFREIAESVHEVFYVRALNPLRALYVNPAYESVWRQPRSLLTGNPLVWTESIVEEDRPRVMKRLAEQESGFFDEEYRISVPGKGIRWIHDRFLPIHDGGHVHRIVGIAEDVTAAKELSKSNAQTIAAEAAVRARDETLSMVAHDIRNPLSAISLTAAALERPSLDPESRARYATNLKRAVRNAERLVRDLLDVTRIESGLLRITLETVDVGTLIAELNDLYQPIAAESSVTLEGHPPEAPTSLACDHDRILQALGNLISNAIKFTPKKGHVTVRVRRSTEGLEFSVEDNGQGISSEDLPHVFDRFWQTRQSDRRGLGLGLAIVKGITHAHEGRVWAESEPGSGSTFHLMIPFHLSAKARDSRAG